MNRDWHNVLTRDESIMCNVHENGGSGDLVRCIKRLAQRIIELEAQPKVVVADSIATINM